MKKDNEITEENPLKEISPDGGYTAILGTVGCIGDSLSSGEHEIKRGGNTIYYDMYDYSWGQFLARKCGLKVYNFSRGGLSAHTFHEYANYCQAFHPEKACKAYIVALGVNDMNHLDTLYPDGFGDMSDVDFDDFTKNRPTFVGDYVKILGRIRDLQPEAKIFLFTVPRSDGGKNKELFDRHAEFIRTLPQYIKNTYVLDFRKYAPDYDAADFKEKYYLHGHMNAMGYKYTADMVATYIDYIIRKHPQDFRRIALVGTEYYFDEE